MCDVRNECHFHFTFLAVGFEELGKLMSGFTFVNVICKRVGSNSTSKVLRSDLWDRLAFSTRCFGCFCSSTGISGNTENGRSSGKIKNRKKWCNECLVVGCIASRVGN